MSEIRVAARTLGPGEPGFVRVLLTWSGKGAPASLLEVPMERLPAPLRTPNASFVAVMRSREFVRVEPAGDAWLEFQDRMRQVLDREWDPIGCGRGWSDLRGWSGEYDIYIAELHTLLEGDASDRSVARWLLEIETKAMGLQPTPMDRLLEVAALLRRIERPKGSA